MHPLYEKACGLTGDIISAAIEVHKTMGPGLIESVYEWCLIKELELRGFRVSNQSLVTIRYKEFCREEPLRYDVLVEQCVLVEVKAVEKTHPIHKAKLITYLKLLDVPIGLMIISMLKNWPTAYLASFFLEQVCSQTSATSATSCYE